MFEELKKYFDQQELNVELEKENKKLEKSLRNATKKIIKYERYLEKITTSIKDDDTVLNFDCCEMLSIERHLDKNLIPVSEIAIMQIDGSLKSWYFYCSSEKHNELCKDFREHIKNK